MTPCYEWTPAGEPPDTDRDVIVWRRRGGRIRPLSIRRMESWAFPWRAKDITHWRDVEPPKDAA